MSNVRQGMKRCFGVIILLLPLLIITAALCGGEPDKKTEGESVRKSKFILTTNDSLLSLRARDASLKEILEAIGRRMKIEEERITIAFDKLSLEDAIKSLSKNYVFVKELGKEKERVTKITILSEGRSRGELPQPAPEEPIEEEPARPEPFKFEFDPSEYEGK
ncbi:MAG: hypothetical protein CV087_14650 [Candidatus Brocadia sp. WS118]|nr:MAG: hypothetical protein CV087_14650 [Candidatus Brocadia sp. WS118]